jgi:hypothetical protein
VVPPMSHASSRDRSSENFVIIGLKQTWFDRVGWEADHSRCIFSVGSQNINTAPS